MSESEEEPPVDLDVLPLVVVILCAGIPRGHKPGRCERTVAEVRLLPSSQDDLLVITPVEATIGWSGLMRKPKTMHRGRRRALVPGDFVGGTDILLCPRPGPFDAETKRRFPNAPKESWNRPSLHNAWYEPDASNPSHYRRWFGAAMFDFELLRPVYTNWQASPRQPQQLRWSAASVSPTLSTRLLEDQFNSAVALYNRGNARR